jgi:hypothetical protein
MNNVPIKILTFCAIGIITVWLLIFYTPIPNKRYQTVERVKFIDGSYVELFGKHSKAGWTGGYFGFHYGVNQQSIFEWERKGKKYIFKNAFIPIVLAEKGETLYVVVFDRESNIPNSVFRFYMCIDSRWQEISYTEFPKNLAIQNAWILEYDRPFKIDPNSEWIKESLTGKLWVLLESGEQYYKGNDRPNEFYVDFYKRYGFNDSMISD